MSPQHGKVPAGALPPGVAEGGTGVGGKALSGPESQSLNSRLLLRGLPALSLMQGPLSDEMSTQGLSWWPGSCGAADRSGEWHQCRPGHGHSHGPPAFLLWSYFSLLPLARLFGMCFTFWDWDWNSLLLPKPSRKFICLKISQALESFEGHQEVCALA